MSEAESPRRVALVTGGAMGIGQAIARRLAAAGHDVAVADLVDAQETAAMITAAGARAYTAQLDITAPGAIDEFVAATTERLGTPLVVVANAGIYPLGPFLDTSWEVWRKIMDLNVDANYRLLQATLPGMIDAGWGRVVALASTVFHAGPPNTAAYAASKGAVIGLVRSLASEVGDFGVTVNAVAPTVVKTPGVMAGPQEELGILEMVRNMQAIQAVRRPRSHCRRCRLPGFRRRGDDHRSDAAGRRRERTRLGSPGLAPLALVWSPGAGNSSDSGGETDPYGRFLPQSRVPATFTEKSWAPELHLATLMPAIELEVAAQSPVGLDQTGVEIAAGVVDPVHERRHRGSEQRVADGPGAPDRWATRLCVRQTNSATTWRQAA